MGTADTPAAPIKGLVLPPEKRISSLPKSTPAAVPKANARTPKTKIMIVLVVRKVSALAVAPTVTPRKMVTMLISSFWAVLLKRSVTPDSRRKFPNIKLPKRGRALGTINPPNRVTIKGKSSLSTLLTGLS